MNSRWVIVAVLVAALVGCSKPEPQSPLDRGKLLVRAGKWEEAITVLTEAIRQDPLNSDAFVQRGRAYLLRGREHIAMAIADYDEAIRLDPNNYEALYNRSIAYAEKGDDKQSLVDKLAAERLDPNVTKLRSKSVDEYSRALQEVENSSSESQTDNGTVPTTNPVPEEAFPPSAPPASNLAIERSGSKPKGETAAEKPGSSTGISEIRDIYGLPISPEPTPTITEQLLGVDEAASKRPTRGDRGVNRIPAQEKERSGFTGRERPTDPKYAAPSPPSGDDGRGYRRSPVGQLPPNAYGVPYQQRAYQNGYSPYSSRAPRSTGFHGDPTAPNVPSNLPYNPYSSPPAPIVPQPQLPDYGP